MRKSRWDKNKRDKIHILKNLISFLPQDPVFSPSLESSPHVSIHILQTQPSPPGQGLRKLLHERCRLSASLQVYKLFCLFRSFIQAWEHSSQFDFYYWQVSILQSHLLCLACLTHTQQTPSWGQADKGLVHTCTSYQWLKCIYQHFLQMRNARVPKCQEKLWRQYFWKSILHRQDSDTIWTFFVIPLLILPPVSPIIMFRNCRGICKFSFLPSGNVQRVSSFLLFGCKWHERNTQGYSSTLSFVSFQLPSSWTIRFLMALPFTSTTSTIYVVICLCWRFISDPQIVCEEVSCCLYHCTSNVSCVLKCWKWSGEVTPAGESTSTETWEMRHLTPAVV